MGLLNWKHHTLIQALIARGPLKEKEFHSIFTGITGKSPGNHKQLFDDYLYTINKELAYVHFELRACRDQYDGEVCYGVVNNIADEQSKLGTKYTVPQIAFYKGIIEAIAQDVTAQGSISSFDALNIQLENQMLTGAGSQSQSGAHDVPPAFKNFTMSQKEKTLHELVQDRWLCYSSDGNIGLGTRSLLDLRSWFRNTDVPYCEVCNEAGVKAELCPNEGCTVRIHHYCLRKMLPKSGAKACPGCGNEWQYRVAEVAEEAMEEEDEPSEPSQTRPPAGRTQSKAAVGPKRKKLRTSRTDDLDVAECGSSQASSVASSMRRITRSSSHLR